VNLQYFRTRKSPGHPVDRSQRSALRGRGATPEDMSVADDAVKNILIASPVYPRYDFGSQIDWFTNRNPAGDVEWLIQLHRHDSWMALGKAYWHTGDEKYAQCYFRQLTDWLDHCGTNNRDFPGWRRLEAAIRSHVFTHHFQYFLDSPSYPGPLLIRFVECMKTHASYLAEGFTKNNWGLMEAEGLAFIAMMFPEFAGSKGWMEQAISHLVAEIDRQVYPDGMHKELCFGYHFGALRWFGRTAELAQLNGLGRLFPEHYETKLEKMAEVAARCLHPDGAQSCFGDDRADDQRPSLPVLAARFPSNGHLAFLASQGREGQAPPTALALPEAGIYSLRSGWDPQAIHFVLKCGPDGGWHCQPDNNTLN
jgi:heparan-sulfate lyase